jgi:hypothetical protein
MDPSDANRILHYQSIIRNINSCISDIRTIPHICVDSCKKCEQCSKCLILEDKIKINNALTEIIEDIVVASGIILDGSMANLIIEE